MPRNIERGPQFEPESEIAKKEKEEKRVEATREQELKEPSEKRVKEVLSHFEKQALWFVLQKKDLEHTMTPGWQLKYRKEYDAKIKEIKRKMELIEWAAGKRPEEKVSEITDWKMQEARAEGKELSNINPDPKVKEVLNERRAERQELWKFTSDLEEKAEKIKRNKR